MTELNKQKTSVTYFTSPPQRSLTHVWGNILATLRL